MNAFETLGIKPGASEREIKKAYFAAVRLHPPDKEPERFKEIRAAYDELRDSDKRMAAESFADLSPEAQKAFDAAQAALKREDVAQALQILTDALADTPEAPLIMLAGEAYMSQGKFGLAVRHYERYCFQFPQNLSLTAALAVAYWSRGWNKRAKMQFLHAITRGYLIPEFLDDFANFCKSEDDIDLLDDVFITVLERLPDEEGASSAAVCLAWLCGYAAHGAEWVWAYLVSRPAFATEAFFSEFFERVAVEISPAHHALARSLSDLVVKYAPGLVNNFDFGRTRYLMEFRLLTESLPQDPSDGERAFVMYAAAVFDREFEGRSSYQDYYEPKKTFEVFDAQMNLISFYRKSRPNLRMVIERYPYLWSFIEEFITKLQSATNLDKFMDRHATGFFRAAGPDMLMVLKNELPKEAYAYYQAMANAPAPVRVSKIQPNAPCPCGSGKKYKKCCGSRV